MEVLFRGALVKQGRSLLAKHVVFVPSPHLSSSLSVHESNVQAHPAGRSWTRCISPNSPHVSYGVFRAFPSRLARLAVRLDM